MFHPDVKAEGNSLYEARKARGMSVQEAVAATGVPRPTLKAYERGVARPGIYWTQLEEVFGAEAMESFRIPTDDSDKWIIYRHLLTRDYPTKQQQAGLPPKTLEEWRTYLDYSPEQMCALFNISHITYNKWRNEGVISRPHIELIRTVFGEIRLK